MSVVEQFRTSPMIKEINAMFEDIANNADKNAVLHQCTLIGMKLSGEERNRLVDAVRSELWRAHHVRSADTKD